MFTQFQCFIVVGALKIFIDDDDDELAGCQMFS